GRGGGAGAAGLVRAAEERAAAGLVDAISLEDADAVRLDALRAAQRDVAVRGVVVALVVEGKPLADQQARVPEEAETDVRLGDVGALRLSAGRECDQRRCGGERDGRTAAHLRAQLFGVLAGARVPSR